MIELRKSDIFKRQVPQSFESIVHCGAAVANLFEQRFDLRAIHQRSSALLDENNRIASCVTCFRGTEWAVARRRQSSNSGAAFAISPDCHLAILMRTLPHCVCTS